MITTRPIFTFAVLVPIAVLVTCCTSAPEPVSTPVAQAPAAAPAPAPRPAPPVAAQPVYDDWMDAPRTPGDWFYRTDGSGTMASYGAPRVNPDFAMRCDPRTQTVSLMRLGTGDGEVPMRVRTETVERLVTASQVGDQLPALRADLDAQDTLLEAMAFSKGRFAIETQGLDTLYIPAWPEVTRVIEDCR